MSIFGNRGRAWLPLILAAFLGLIALLVYGIWGLATARRELYNLSIGLLLLSAASVLAFRALKRGLRRKARQRKAAAS